MSDILKELEEHDETSLPDNSKAPYTVNVGLLRKAALEIFRLSAQRDKAVEALREAETTLKEWQRFPASDLVKLSLDMVQRAEKSIRATLAEIEGE